LKTLIQGKGNPKVQVKKKKKNILLAMIFLIKAIPKASLSADKTVKSVEWAEI